VITIIGLGPGSLERVSSPVRDVLLDDDRAVIVRTLSHPAAAELAGLREIVSCDDLYDRADQFDDVYSAIRRRAGGLCGPGEPDDR
jgi:uncharacterized protein YabN with tetrapyrrole methylase and pyrophosphatase domain